MTFISNLIRNLFFLSIKTKKNLKYKEGEEVRVLYNAVSHLEVGVFGAHQKCHAAVNPVKNKGRL